MQNINSMISVNRLVNLAMAEIQNLNSNNGEFIMRDLFVGYQWDSVPINVRMQAGKLFYQQIMNTNRFAERGVTKDGQQIYVAN